MTKIPNSKHESGNPNDENSKFEARNSKQIRMTKMQNSKHESGNPNDENSKFEMQNSKQIRMTKMRNSKHESGNPNDENAKFEARNSKQIRMTKIPNSKHESRNSKRYDLEDRTLEFARNVRAFVKKLPKSLANYEDARQLIKSSGSVGANYIEANEALSKKDFLLRIKICRKEAKESRY